MLSGLGLSKVDVITNPCFTRLIQKAKQSHAFANTVRPAYQDDETGVGNCLCKGEKVIPIASDQYVIVLGGETQNIPI
jgi:hypothetical protein